MSQNGGWWFRKGTGADAIGAGKLEGCWVVHRHGKFEIAVESELVETPQGLKPGWFMEGSGTAEAVRFPKLLREPFR
jgi:hypothetical protein